MITTKARVIVDRVSAIFNVNIANRPGNRKQSLFLTQKGYVNVQQNINNKDDVFEVQLWNNAIDKFNLLGMNLHQKKVDVELYVKGRRYLKDGSEVYEVVLTLKSIEIVK